MTTRPKRPATIGFETTDLVSWLHDSANLIRNLDSCMHLLGSPDTDETTRADVHESAMRTLSMLKELFPTYRDTRRQQRRSSCDLNEAVTACVEMLRPYAQRGAVALDITGLAKSSVVKGSDLTHRRAIYNVILNGLEATAPGGSVAVHTARDRNTVRLVVSDSGIGISQSTRRRLFKRPVSTKRSGSGHGLMRTAATVAASGGTIKVDSAPRKGTTITLELPAVQPSGFNREQPSR